MKSKFIMTDCISYMLFATCSTSFFVYDLYICQCDVYTCRYIVYSHEYDLYTYGSIVYTCRWIIYMSWYAIFYLDKRVFTHGNKILYHWLFFAVLMELLFCTNCKIGTNNLAMLIENLVIERALSEVFLFL